MGKSANDVVAGGAVVTIGGDDSPFNKVVDAAERRLKLFGQNALAIGAKFGALTSGLAVGLVTATKSFASAGQAINNVAMRVGDSAKNVSQLGYAATVTGGNLQTLESGLNSMSDLLTKASKGDEDAIATLKKLGFVASDLKGMLPTQQFEKFAEALKGITDQGQRQDLMQAIFGGSANQLAPLLNQGATGIAKLRKEAEALGVTMSGRDAKAAAALAQAFSSLNQSVGAIITKFGSALAPALLPIIQYVTQAAAGVAKWIDANRQIGPQAAMIVTALAGMGAGFVAIGAAAMIVGPTIKLAMGIASIAVYGVSMAVAVVNTTVAVASAVVKVLGGIVSAVGVAFRLLSATTVSFTIASTACSLAMRAVGVAISITMSIMKTAAVATAAMTVAGGLLATGMVSLSTAFKIVMVTVNLARGSIFGLANAYLILSGASTVATTSVTAAGIAISILSNPITIAIAALTALAAALYFTGAFQAIWDAAKSAFDGIAKFANDSFGGIVDYLATWPGAIMGYMGEVGANFSALWGQIVSVAQSAFESAKKVFFDLLGTATTTFKGIQDAIQSGNIQLAMDILWAGLKLAWSQGCDALKNTWDMGMLYIEGAVDTVATNIKAIWDVAINYLIGAFDKFTTSIRNKWQDLSGWLAEGIASTGVFGEVDAETFKEQDQAIRQQINAGADERENQRNAAIANAGGDAEARKRAEARRQAEAAINNRPGESPETAALKAQLAALTAQAAAAAKNGPMSEEAIKNGQAAMAEEAGRGSYNDSTAANARGSAGAASTIAKAVNASTSNAEQQQLKSQQEATKLLNKAVTWLSEIAKNIGLTIEETT